jgi:FlaA1/EpsC-like NDP-sugar epimerase
MGNPVRINEVAERLASESAEPVEIVYTGLRPGEKLHESLFGIGEADDRPVHPLISHVRVPPLDGDAYARLNAPNSPSDLKALLQLICVVAPPGGVTPFGKAAVGKEVTSAP